MTPEKTLARAAGDECADIDECALGEDNCHVLPPPAPPLCCNTQERTYQLNEAWP